MTHSNQTRIALAMLDLSEEAGETLKGVKLRLVHYILSDIIQDLQAYEGHLGEPWKGSEMEITAEQLARLARFVSSFSQERGTDEGFWHAHPSAEGANNDDR